MVNNTCFKTRRHKSVKKIVDHIGNTLFWILIIGFGIGVAYYAGRILVADQFVIPTWSMVPTLHAGDRVVVNKLTFGPRIYKKLHFEYGMDLESWRLKGYRGIRHNDVVVFNYPINNWRISFKINYVYCKRCVGLPGDVLSIVDGHYRNNNYDGVLGVKSEQDKLEQRADSTFNENAFYILSNRETGWTIKNMGEMYIPRRGDVVSIGKQESLLYRQIIEFETKENVEIGDEGLLVVGGETLKRYQFKDNYYSMAGDNVCDSNDSRYWGLVPEEYIIGVADFISYSLHYQTGELSKDRCLRWIE